MDERQREIDRRIRRAQRQIFLGNLREHWLLIAIGLTMLGVIGFGIAWTSAPDRLGSTVLAKIVNDGGLQATRRGTQYHKETVQLPSGIRITVDLPAGDPVRVDTPMKIEIHETAFGPFHRITYRFAGYADGQSKQPG
jgi:hypothetical protein